MYGLKDTLPRTEKKIQLNTKLTLSQSPAITLSRNFAAEGCSSLHEDSCISTSTVLLSNKRNNHTQLRRTKASKPTEALKRSRHSTHFNPKPCKCCPINRTTSSSFLFKNFLFNEALLSPLAIHSPFEELVSPSSPLGVRFDLCISDSKSTERRALF